MANIDELKNENIQKVRELFYKGETWTKTIISEKTGLSLAGVTNILKSLLEIGEIEYVGDGESTGGRKSKIYRLKKDYSSIAEVLLLRDALEYEITLRVRNLGGEIIVENSIRRKNCVLTDIVDFIDDTVSAISSLKVIVISVPGVVKDGHCVTCDFEMLEDVFLTEEVSKKTGVACIAENDVNLAAIKMSKDLSKYQNIALFYQPKVLSAGVGIILNGELFSGKNGAAGEVQFLPAPAGGLYNEMQTNNAAKLLKMQMDSVQAVLNLDAIIWNSAAFDGDLPEESTIPKKYEPAYIHVGKLDQLISQGLDILGREYLWRNRI
ncbi:MAG: ROK family protein [Eubacteriales bacterium]|nr:ROK family protein [Eubacteriales bacterium]